VPYTLANGAGGGGRRWWVYKFYITFKCLLLGLTDCHSKSDFFINLLMHILKSIVGSDGRE